MQRGKSQAQSAIWRPLSPGSHRSHVPRVQRRLALGRHGGACPRERDERDGRAPEHTQHPRSHGEPEPDGDLPRPPCAEIPDLGEVLLQYCGSGSVQRTDLGVAEALPYGICGHHPRRGSCKRRLRRNTDQASAHDALRMTDLQLHAEVPKQLVVSSRDRAVGAIEPEPIWKGLAIGQGSLHFERLAVDLLRKQSAGWNSYRISIRCQRFVWNGLDDLLNASL
mmetsp:Transcript_7128/g.15405  ORF Transcript_7128/g.15405 Transcript_7128/m.15405 type:complete len:223 (-) Transcript_7128:1465-2133(-)